MLVEAWRGFGVASLQSITHAALSVITRGGPMSAHHDELVC